MAFLLKAKAFIVAGGLFAKRKTPLPKEKLVSEKKISHREEEGTHWGRGSLVGKRKARIGRSGPPPRRKHGRLCPKLSSRLKGQAPLPKPLLGPKAQAGLSRPAPRTKAQTTLPSPCLRAIDARKASRRGEGWLFVREAAWVWREREGGRKER